MSNIVNHSQFKHATNYLFRLNKRISDGMVTAFFIFPIKFQLNLESIERYAKIIKIKQDQSIGLEIEFKTKELSDYFWDNWKCDYKFETND